MSRLIDERSPRTLLDSAFCLREALYDGGDSVFDKKEVVIETSDGTSAPASRASTGTGFILREVEHVLVDIRRDLDIPVDPETGGASQPLMLRIRVHTDEISHMLTGSSVQPNDGTTTISQLILDINRLKDSVQDTTRSACIIL